MARTSVPVDKKHFLAIVRQIEGEGNTKTLGDFYDAVAKAYNTEVRPIRQLTKAVVALRVKEWKIKINARKGKGIEVNQAKLKRCIATVEANGPVEGGRVAMCNLVADKYNEDGKDGEITHSVVMLRIKEWNIPIKTPSMKGQGRKGQTGWQGGPRRTKAEKFAASPSIQASLKAIRKEAMQLGKDVSNNPNRFLPLVEQVENGSRAAAVKLHCIFCATGSTVEVKHCQVIDCPMRPFRPYQGGETDEFYQDNDQEKSPDDETEAA